MQVNEKELQQPGQNPETEKQEQPVVEAADNTQAVEQPSVTEEAKPETAEESVENLSMDQILEAESALVKKINAREMVSLKVVQVTEDSVYVNIGEKKEAVIPLSEFENEKTPEPGDEVTAIFERKSREGTIMSHRRARERVAYAAVQKLFEAGSRVKGKITDIIKGGYLVDLNGLRAFMPLSLSELGGAHKHYLPTGAKVKVYITDFSEKDKKVIVSRRKVLEEDEKARKEKTLSEISEGAIVRGVVSRTTEDSVLVRFQGIDGIVRLEDISWKDPKEALQKYDRGVRVRCKILAIDREKEFITFGFKQIMPNPAIMLRRKFPPRSRVKAKITAVSEAGADAKINDTVDAFIMTEDYGADGAPSAGDEVNAVVVGINKDEFKVKLSIRRNEEQEDRKKFQAYFKEGPHFTLGQILNDKDK